MSKTSRKFPIHNRDFSQPKQAKPQPRDKSCGQVMKTVAQNYRRELSLEQVYA